MLRSFIYITVVLALVGCGKEQGVQARLHAKTVDAPQEVVANAYKMLDSKNASYQSSVSSQAIRNDTLGFTVKTAKNTDGSTNLRVEHFQGYDTDSKCRNSIHEIKLDTASLTKWSYGSTMSVRCYDNSCNYLLIILEQAQSSYVDGTGALVPAYVPIILQKTIKQGGTYYDPSMVSTAPFLKLSVNTTCNSSDQVVRYPLQMAVSPIDNDTGAPNYNYYPDPYNNTWIY